MQVPACAHSKKKINKSLKEGLSGSTVVRYNFVTSVSYLSTRALRCANGVGSTAGGCGGEGLRALPRLTSRGRSYEARVGYFPREKWGTQGKEFCLRRYKAMPRPCGLYCILFYLGAHLPPLYNYGFKSKILEMGRLSLSFPCCPSLHNYRPRGQHML